MKKLISLLIITGLFSLNLSNANADLGGYAVVDPSTGIVHGVIVGNSADPYNNGGVMPMEYMGCPVGCLIVPQSTADQNGNVAGIRSDENITVKYEPERRVFTISETNVIETQTIIESVSNTSLVETDLSVFRSEKTYEFGFQNLLNNNGFQLVEVSPNQNTNAKVSGITKEYECEESPIICSKLYNNSSQILNNELIEFDQRLYANQIEQQIITEAKNKIREQINLVLLLLGKWVID